MFEDMIEYFRTHDAYKDRQKKNDAECIAGYEPVVDVGCGIGRLFRYVESEAIGVDRNHQSLLQVKQVARKHAVQGDAVRLPFLDESVGCVHCSDLIEHLAIPDAMSLLVECGRIVRPGGRLVLCGPFDYKGFWNDFSHVKPYFPKPIVRYLTARGGRQRTMNAYPFQFKLVAYRCDRSPFFYAPLIGLEKFYYLYAFLKQLGVWLSVLGVTTLEKRRFTLVLDKM